MDKSGFDLPRPRPPRTAMAGRLVRLEPFSVAEHSRDLFMAFGEDTTGTLWQYLPAGPFATLADYVAHARQSMVGADPLHFAIVDQATGRACGSAAYLRITPEHGVMEVGWLAFSPRLQRRPAATEAMYLMAERAFDELGYRRYEWKCNNLNEASKRAAGRLGFTYEGVFRQHMVVRGENRDTAWFSITDGEWPTVKAAFEAWLDPVNFDENGRQLCKLADLRAAISAARGSPAPA